MAARVFPHSGSAIEATAPLIRTAPSKPRWQSTRRWSPPGHRARSPSIGRCRISMCLRDSAPVRQLLVGLVLSGDGSGDGGGECRAHQPSLPFPGTSCAWSSASSPLSVPYGPNGPTCPGSASTSGAPPFVRCGPGIIRRSRRHAESAVPPPRPSGEFLAALCSPPTPHQGGYATHQGRSSRTSHRHPS